MSTMGDLERRLVERIHREGPLPFDAFVEAALYGDGGFFASGHGAGRAGADFVTSPEVGQLFGVLVARYLDDVWDELGRPAARPVTVGAHGGPTYPRQAWGSLVTA